MSSFVFRPFHGLAASVPFGLAAALYYFHFSINSERMLTIFLPVVWSVMFALGGGIVFLKRYNFIQRSKTAQNISAHIQVTAFILIVEMVFFLFLGGLYPARDFLLRFSWVVNNFVALSTLYDCLVFSFFFIPSFFSALVGAWCIGLLVSE